MTLETYYLLSLSIGATLFSVLVIILIISSVWLNIRLRKLLDKVDTLANSSLAMSQDIKELVQTTTDRLVSFEKNFLTLQGIKQVAHEIAEVIKSRNNKEKE